MMQSSVAMELLDVTLWKQERDAIAETKQLRRTIEAERSECRKQVHI